MELSVDQLLYVGIVASVITQGLALLANKFGFEPTKVVRNIGLMVVSIVMGIVFIGLPEMPFLEDPMAFLGAILAQATLIFGAAAAVYAVLLKKIVQPVNA